MIYFFDLPRELRDMIYVRYVLIDGGYTLDFNSNTLKGADNKPIDLSFMLTCKRVAEEMKGIALSSNTLNFSTFYSEEHNAIAGRFGIMVNTLHFQLGHKMNNIRPDTLNIPDNIWGELSEAHPRFSPYLEVVRNRRDLDSQVERDNVGSPGSCGETPSAFRNFVHHALRTVMSHEHRFDVEQFAEFANGQADSDQIRLESLVNFNPDLWVIPTLQRLEEMISEMGGGAAKAIARVWGQDMPGFKASQVKHHYSAAAVAIRFLQSLPEDSRSSIRSIVLNEDRAAIAFSECHGFGFIPYCQENPDLRVERRVSMWRTVFQTTTANKYGYVMPPFEGQSLEANEISHSVAVWITEALELKAAGMPRGSFTLTFDGDWACSEIFQAVIHRDAAWQTAIDICLQRGILPPLSWDLRRRDPRNHLRFNDEFYQQNNRWYLFEAFPQAIQDILAGTSIIKCNFGLGEAWDVERLIEENKGFTLDEWKAAWFVREKQTFEPDPFSPSWVQLLCDNSSETILPLSDWDPFD